MKKLLLLVALCASMATTLWAQAITEQPEGEAVLYSRTGQAIFSLSETYIGEQNDLVKIVFDADGETVYFQNILYRMDQYYYESWAVGKFNADHTKITVDFDQVVGYDDFNYLDIVLSFASSSLDENQVVTYTRNQNLTQATFTVDPETGVITLDGTSGDMYNGTGYEGWVATGLAAYTTDGEWAGFMSWGTTLTPMGAPTPAVPRAPYDLTWENGSDWELPSLHFHINPFDVDGNRLYEDNFSYRVYMDNDQLYTFTAAEFGPGEIFDNGDITEVPLYYSDYVHFISWDGTRVYFNQGNLGEDRLFNRRIGVQAIYTVGGVSNESEIAYVSVLAVHGVVVDKEGNPVPNVTVAFTPKPSQNPAGQRESQIMPVYLTTNENGEFATELIANIDLTVEYMVDWETILTNDLSLGEDDVDMGVIVLPIGSSGITEISTTNPESKGVIYNLAGQPMRGDLSTLPHGIYIVNGKKVVK
jgi:hypothetical protein